VWGDCSFVVEEAEAWILWEFTEAHQTIELSKAQKNIKTIENFNSGCVQLPALQTIPFPVHFYKKHFKLKFVINDFGWKWLVDSFYNKMMVRARFMYKLGFRDKKWVRWMIWG